MEIFREMFEAILAYWYITVPEIAYILFMGFSFIGPVSVFICALYVILFAFFPKEVMIAVGAVIAVHAAFILIKSFIGDRFAKRKQADEKEEYKGVPKLVRDHGKEEKISDK